MAVRPASGDDSGDTPSFGSGGDGSVPIGGNGPRHLRGDSDALNRGARLFEGVSDQFSSYAQRIDALRRDLPLKGNRSDETWDQFGPTYMGAADAIILGAYATFQALRDGVSRQLERQSALVSDTEEGHTALAKGALNLAGPPPTVSYAPPPEGGGEPPPPVESEDEGLAVAFVRRSEAGGGPPPPVENEDEGLAVAFVRHSPPRTPGIPDAISTEEVEGVPGSPPVPGEVLDVGEAPSSSPVDRGVDPAPLVAGELAVGRTVDPPPLVAGELADESPEYQPPFGTRFTRSSPPDS